MPTLGAETLEAITRDVFTGWRVPKGDAALVATLLVRANLRGHDSHGVIRIPHDVRAIKAGEVNPPPAIRVEADAGRTRGIPIEEETWRQIRECAAEAGVVC